MPFFKPNSVNTPASFKRTEIMEQKIAAVLVDYKGLKLTLKTIESLKASKVPMGIIVIDNDPLSDDTEKIKEI